MDRQSPDATPTANQPKGGQPLGQITQRLCQTDQGDAQACATRAPASMRWAQHVDPHGEKKFKRVLIWFDRPRAVEPRQWRAVPLRY